MVCLVLGLTFDVAAAAAQESKIEGYSGYRFGMSLEEAKRVHPTQIFNCAAGRTCLSYETKVSAFDASVIVPITGATVSIVTAAAKLALLVLPAASTELTTTVLVALSPVATVYVAV